MPLRLNEQHPAALIVVLPVAGLVGAVLVGYVTAWRICRRLGWV